MLESRLLRPSMRAVIYSRVSTDAQERDGTSLETQERECMAYAQAHRWDVIECISEAASGYTLERPGMERVRSLLQQGSVDIVLSYEVDRLSRNQNITGVLLDETERAGARLDFVPEDFEDTAVGKFILEARAFVAEVERGKIAERTMRGKLERARAGKLPQGTGRGATATMRKQVVER
ncbi:MAG TPA: recombinase family protein [Dehalococcoidia bacterium]|nr:recombinase family protein [Dehalococcoidia bacterium]